MCRGKKHTKDLPGILLKIRRTCSFTTITVNSKAANHAATFDYGELKARVRPPSRAVWPRFLIFEVATLVFPSYQNSRGSRERRTSFWQTWPNQVHGNTPLLKSDGYDPNAGQEAREISAFSYYQEKMESSPRSRKKRKRVIKNWEKGHVTVNSSE